MFAPLHVAMPKNVFSGVADLIFIFQMASLLFMKTFWETAF